MVVNNLLNLKAITGSIALHVFIGTWFLFKALPVETNIPQSVINVALIPVQEIKGAVQGNAEASRPVAEASQISPKPIQKTAVKKNIAPAEQKNQPRQATTDSVVKNEFTALSPSAGAARTLSAPAASQEITTAPLFDASYLNNPAPQYPAQAKRRGMEGAVMLNVLVTKAGAAESVTIEQSSGFAMLDNAAMEAVMRWKFTPVRRGNESIEAHILVPIEFKLK